MNKRRQTDYSVNMTGSGSFNVVIPVRFAKELSIDRGDKLRVTVEDGRLIMRKVKGDAETTATS